MWYQFKKTVVFVIYLVLLNGCVATGKKPPPALVLQGHALVNRIWDVKAGHFIEREQLNKHIVASDYLLLGETHDNIRHHQLQASVIDTLRQYRRDASVSFEMITDQQAELLKRHAVTSSSTLIALLQQAKSNWDYDTQYRVVFDSVLAAGYAIRPANLSRGKLRQMMKRGEEELPQEIKRVLTQVPLSKQQRAVLQRDIVKSHCDMIPLEATGPMALAQRIRDAVMSRSLLQSQHETKVLIAGAGHARTDRGVPLYLRRLDRDASIVSIVFREVDAEAVSMAPYLQRRDGQTLAFDYIWFTPAVETDDPCLGFKMKKG